MASPLLVPLSALSNLIAQLTLVVTCMGLHSMESNFTLLTTSSLRSAKSNRLRLRIELISTTRESRLLPIKLTLTSSRDLTPFNLFSRFSSLSRSSSTVACPSRTTTITIRIDLRTTFTITEETTSSSSRDHLDKMSVKVDTRATIDTLVRTDLKDRTFRFSQLSLFKPCPSR